MGRSQETFNKKEVRNKKEKKEKKRKKEKERELARKDSDSKGGLDDMIAYVDEKRYDYFNTARPPKKKKTVIKAEDIDLSIANRDSGEEIDPIRKGVVSFF